MAITIVKQVTQTGDREVQIDNASVRGFFGGLAPTNQDFQVYIQKPSGARIFVGDLDNLDKLVIHFQLQNVLPNT